MTVWPQWISLVTGWYEAYLALWKEGVVFGLGTTMELLVVRRAVTFLGTALSSMHCVKTALALFHRVPQCRA